MLLSLMYVGSRYWSISAVVLRLSSAAEARCRSCDFAVGDFCFRILTGLAGVFEVLPRCIPRGRESPLLEVSASFLLALWDDFYLLRGFGDFRPEKPLAFEEGSTSS